MLDERLLDYDPHSGMKTWFSSEDEGDTWHIRYEQDVAPSLDACKEAQNESWDKRDNLWHAAHVPNVIQMEWAVKYGIELWNPDHKDGVKRLLNHPDYRYLRVRNFII